MIILKKKHKSVEKATSNNIFKSIWKKTESMALYYEKNFGFNQKNEMINQEIDVFTDCFDRNAEQRQWFIDK